jgi:hypothetical protein
MDAIKNGLNIVFCCIGLCLMVTVCYWYEIPWHWVEERLPHGESGLTRAAFRVVAFVGGLLLLLGDLDGAKADFRGEGMP